LTQDFPAQISLERFFSGLFPRNFHSRRKIMRRAAIYFLRARIAATRIEFFRTKIFYLVNDRGAKSRGCA